MSVKANIVQLKGSTCGQFHKLRQEIHHSAGQPSSQRYLSVDADGLPRPYSPGGKVILNGVFAPIAGTICMDQCMLDVTHVPYPRLGDEGHNNRKGRDLRDHGR